MTKIYFVETNADNRLIATDEETAFTFNDAPSGRVDGIDLYADDAIDQFKEFYRTNAVNSYHDMGGEHKFPYEELKKVLDNEIPDHHATIVYECEDD